EEGTSGGRRASRPRTRPPRVCLRTCGHAVAIAGCWLLLVGAEVLGESPPAGDGGVLKETYVECSDKITHADPRPLHWSPYGASDSPAKTPANATLKFDVELLAFGPKAKEM
ncbi:hypothetical protein PF010_g17120, partial [Phytophthora fragariae]